MKSLKKWYGNGLKPIEVSGIVVVPGQVWRYQGSGTLGYLFRITHVSYRRIKGIPEGSTTIKPKELSLDQPNEQRFWTCVIPPGRLLPRESPEL